MEVNRYRHPLARLRLSVQFDLAGREISYLVQQTFGAPTYTLGPGCTICLDIPGFQGRC